jgi:hypothetical protein
MTLTNVTPAVSVKRSNILSIKKNIASIITTLTIEVATQRGFSCSRGRLYKITFTPLEAKITTPYVRMEILARGKNIRYDIM